MDTANHLTALSSVPWLQGSSDHLTKRPLFLYYTAVLTFMILGDIHGWEFCYIILYFISQYPLFPPVSWNLT